MLFPSEIETRLARGEFDRRGFLLGGASSIAILSTADAQLLGLHPGSGQSQTSVSCPACSAVSGIFSTPSLNFTQTNNTLNATSGTSAAGVVFPGTAMNTPAVGANGWFAGLFFYIPAYTSQPNTQTIAHNAYAGTLGGVGAALMTSTTTPSGGIQGFFTSGILNAVIANANRGQGYFYIFGQTAANTFFVALLDTLGNVLYTQGGAHTATFNNVSVLTSLGATTTSTPNAFNGSVSNAFMAWGVFPNAAGAPDQPTLKNIATGVVSIQSVVSGISGASLRYFCPLAGPMPHMAATAAVSTGSIIGAVGNLPGTLRAGQLVWNITQNLPVGNVASWDTLGKTVTLSQANPLNAIAANDTLMLGASVTTTAAVSTGSTIPVDVIPNTIARGQNIYDLTTGKTIGTVSDWSSYALTITISQANPANAIGSGDVLSVHGLNADPASVATTAPMGLPPSWAHYFQPLMGEAIQPSPWLTIAPKADGSYYVWGINPGATTAKVWFRGTYAVSNGVVPTFEAKLTRRRDGSPHVNWTPLVGATVSPATGDSVSIAGGYATNQFVTLVFTATKVALPMGATITATGFTTPGVNGTWTVCGATSSSVTFQCAGVAPTLTAEQISSGSLSWSVATYEGYIMAPTGASFTRSLRFAGQPNTAVHSSERHAAGIVTFWHAQSQTTYFLGVYNGGGADVGSANVGSSSMVPPIDTDDVYTCATTQFANASADASAITSTASTIAPATWSATGSISGTVMTITAMTSGAIWPGPLNQGATGTTVVSQISGTTGGVGTYLVNVGQTLNPGTLSGSYGVLTLGGTIAGGSFAAGMSIYGPGINAGVVYISALLTGTGNVAGATFAITAPLTVAATSITGALFWSDNSSNAQFWGTAALHGGAYGAYVSNVRFAGLLGDGPVLFAKTLGQQSGLPVMVVTAAMAGHSQGDFFTDRGTVTCTPHPTTGGKTGTGDNWTPDGTKTVYTIANGNPIWLQGVSATWAGAGKTDPFGNPYPAAWTLLNNGTGQAYGAPVVPGTFSGTIAGISISDDGNGNIVGVGVSGTIDYTGVQGASYPSLSLTFTTAPASGQQYLFNWTLDGQYNATTGSGFGLKAGPDGYSCGGVVGVPRTGYVSDAFCALGNNNVTATIHMWWTYNVGTGTYTNLNWTSYSASLQAYEGTRWYMKSFPQAQNAMRFWAPAGREAAGGSVISGKYGGARYALYQYVANAKKNGLTDVEVLGDAMDICIPGNSGPHQGFDGGMVEGQRHGYAVAAGLGYGGMNLYSGLNGQVSSGTGASDKSAGVMGPVLASVTRTTVSGKAALVLTYDLPNGTALATYQGGGIGSTVVGFLVGTGTTQSAAYSAASQAWSDAVVTSPSWTASITASNQVTIVASSLGSWSAYVSLSYCNGYSVYTGGGSTQTYNDNTTMMSLLCDNAGGYAWPTAALRTAWKCMGTPAGNASSGVIDWPA
jgi:hypothetical protein